MCVGLDCVTFTFEIESLERERVVINIVGTVRDLDFRDLVHTCEAEKWAALRAITESNN